VGVEIVRYEPGSHEEGASRALGAAFADDPAITYLVGGPARLDSASWCLRQGIRLATSHGHGLVALEGGRVLGGSFWVPPGTSPAASTLTQLGLGGWQAPWHLGLRGTLRELWREEDLARRYARDLAIPSWYLDLLGVDPAAQGRGLGKALIASMLERADHERVPIYLVTHKRSNVDYYRRFGFEVLTDATLRGIPTGWSMRRPPG
jgi:GNAT superfamily N-acetyltransferase